MQRIVIQLLSSIAALAIYGSAGAADIYKWIDANGVTHYSDAAPEAIEIRPPGMNLLPPVVTQALT